MEIETKSCATCLGFNNVAKTYFAHDPYGSSTCLMDQAGPVADDMTHQLLWVVSKAIVEDGGDYKWASIVRFGRSVGYLLMWATMSLATDNPEVAPHLWSINHGSYSDMTMTIHQMSQEPPSSAEFPEPNGELYLYNLIQLRRNHPDGLCQLINYDTDPRFLGMVKRAKEDYLGCVPDQQPSVASMAYSAISGLMSDKSTHSLEEDEKGGVSMPCDHAIGVLRLSALCAQLDLLTDDPQGLIVTKARKIVDRMITDDPADKEQLHSLRRMLSVDFDESRTITGSLLSCEVAGSPPNRWIVVFKSLLTSLVAYESLAMKTNDPEIDKPPISEDGSLTDQAHEMASIVMKYLTLIDELTGDRIMNRDPNHNPLFFMKHSRRRDHPGQRSLSPQERGAEMISSHNLHHGITEVYEYHTLIDGLLENDDVKSVTDEVTPVMKSRATRNGELWYSISKGIAPESGRMSLNHHHEINRAGDTADHPIRQTLDEHACAKEQRERYSEILSAMIASSHVSKSGYHHEDLVLFEQLMDGYC